MLTNLPGRLLLIAALVLLSLWVLNTRGITYGLDLRGGTHLALEVALPRIDRAAAGIEVETTRGAPAPNPGVGLELFAPGIVTAAGEPADTVPGDSLRPPQPPVQRPAPSRVRRSGRHLSGR